jgi:hypothetical protein
VNHGAPKCRSVLALQVAEDVADEPSMRAVVRVLAPVFAFLAVVYVPPVRNFYDARIASLSKAFGHSVQHVVDDLSTTTTTSTP